MPELPDLEVLRGNLAPRAVGRTVRGVAAGFPSFLRTVAPPVSDLVGKELEGVDRRGKYLLFEFAGDLQLAIHLMRWGWIWHGKSTYAPTRSTAFRLSLDDGTDIRVIEPGPTKLAGAWMLESGEQGPLAELGLEPLAKGFTLEAFHEMVIGKRRQLKRVLTDQKLIAGIGNAYADEILFAARLSPIHYAHTLEDEEVERLWRAIPETLRWAIEEIKKRVGDGLFEQEVRDFLWVHGRAGKPCRACGTPIEEIRHGQQRTDYCPNCQSVNRPPRTG